MGSCIKPKKDNSKELSWASPGESQGGSFDSLKEGRTILTIKMPVPDRNCQQTPVVVLLPYSEITFREEEEVKVADPVPDTIEDL